MGKENRRSPRYKSNLPVTLLLRENASGSNLVDPLAGSLDDLSLHGVRLSVPHIRIGDHHLFHTFADNQRQTIYLEIPLPHGSSPPLCIPVRPVWFDHLLSLPAQPFQIGMEFLLPIEDEQLLQLNALFVEKRAREGSWWRWLLGSHAGT